MSDTLQERARQFLSPYAPWMSVDKLTQSVDKLTQLLAQVEAQGRQQGADIAIQAELDYVNLNEEKWREKYHTDFPYDDIEAIKIALRRQAGAEGEKR